MKNKILLTLAVAALALGSCKKDDLMLFNGKTTLNFEKAYYLGGASSQTSMDLDTLRIITAYHGGKTTLDVECPFRMSGPIVNVDRPFSVRINTERTRGDIVEGTHYTLERTQILKADKYSGSVIVGVNLAKLKADRIEGVLVIEFVPDENFALGMDRFRSIAIQMSGKGFGITQPNFYTTAVNELVKYLGTYNRFVCETFSEYAGVTDEKWASSNHFQRYNAAQKTFLWHKNNPTDKITGLPTDAANANRIDVSSGKFVGGTYKYE